MTCKQSILMSLLFSLSFGGITLADDARAQASTTAEVNMSANARVGSDRHSFDYGSRTELNADAKADRNDGLEGQSDMTLVQESSIQSDAGDLATDLRDRAETKKSELQASAEAKIDELSGQVDAVAARAGDLLSDVESRVDGAVQAAVARALAVEVETTVDEQIAGAVDAAVEQSIQEALDSAVEAEIDGALDGALASAIDG